MSGAHGEILTFLLSDIEGSARRWDRDDDAMARALERHDALLRKIIESQGGRWLKHTGDGALAVFPSALAAVAGAVAAQRALRDEDWDEVGGLRARMALHTGEARERDGDYFGQTLNRVARLLGAAHGGQVLASLATEEVVRDRLPSGVGLRDLGVHTLADLSHPEHVFQVVTEDLPREFPSLRTTTGTRQVLPSFRTSFVGREGDLAALATAVAEHRVVTLTGVGGSGKTRLAVELAHDIADRFPDGVFFVDLASITDEELVARQTAQAIGVVTGGVAAGSLEPIDQQLLRTVRDKTMLLLLDNCEHLLDACAEHVEELLAASEGLRVVATSREALALEGEQTWPVTSLAVPRVVTEEAASLRLLRDRLREVRPDLEVRDEDRPALVEICQRLDGLPLALELAAARLAHMSAADVAARLDDRFRLLAGGRRRTERQQTLRATIDWSYDLLDEDERTLLRRLSVFAGGAPLEAVEAVAMDGTETALAIDLVGRLVARSLVVAETAASSTRYRLLETIRLYAEEKLVEAGEAEEIRRRHRDWYLAWLDTFPWDLRLVSPVVADRIQTEYDNLRLAMEWSASAREPHALAQLVSGLAGFGVLNGYADELDRWRPVAHAAGLDPVTAAELDAHGGYMDCWRYNGDPSSFDVVRERTDAAYHALPEQHRYRSLARCIFGASHTVTHPREPWRIEEPAREAMELADAVEAPWVRIMAMAFVARARLYERDAAGARAMVEAAMSMPEWTPEHDGHNLRHELAVALHLLGDDEAALEQALQVADSGSVTWRHVGDLDASVIVAALGDPEGGRGHIRNLLARLEELRWHHPLAISDCTIALGGIATYEGRWEDAARLLAVSGANTSHPAVFALWVHYRDRVRDALPREVRRRCIEAGTGADPRAAIEEEIGPARGATVPDRVDGGPGTPVREA